MLPRNLALALLSLASLPAWAQDAAPGGGGTEGDIGALVKQSSSSLVFIEGGGGSGSGFVCKMQGALYLVTNQHVVAPMPRMKFTTLDNRALKPGGSGAAVGHDVMRMALPEAPSAFEASEKLEQDARIGDAVAVLGNSEGSRVIAPLVGKLLGIGPDRIEVSAEFVPGNSGSPIVHLASGKVIGIATYVETRRFAALTDSKEQGVRRFGYRLDSIKQWQPVAWPAYQAEYAALHSMETLTQDIDKLMVDLMGDDRFHPSNHTNRAIARPVQELDRALSRRGISPPDRQRVLQNFFAALRTVSQADVRQAREAWRYDFFRRSLEEQVAIRDQYHLAFDRMVKSTR